MSASARQIAGGERRRGARVGLRMLYALVLAMASSTSMIIGGGAALLVGPASSTAHAQAEEGEPKSLLERSLPLRASLHHDATLEAAFDQLVKMYREAGRLEELVGIYQSHVTQYPLDRNATIVLIRLLHSTGRPEALSTARAAVGRFPDQAYVHYLLATLLEADDQAESVDALQRAVSLTQMPMRKREWLEMLIPKLLAQERRDDAAEQLEALAALVADSPEGQLDAAQKMIKFGFHELALRTLGAMDESTLSGPMMLETQLASTEAEIGLGRVDAATQRLDALLGRLSPDHWMRGEILRRLASLVRTDAQRQARIDAARQRMSQRPRDDRAALELVELLVGFQYRREALDVLLEAGKRIPGSMRLEKATLDLFDELRDEIGRERYLAERIEQQPERGDLVLARARSLYLLGRGREARRIVDKLVASLPPADQITQRLAIARFLRDSSMPAEAVREFEQVVTQAPDRLDVMRELAELYVLLGDWRKIQTLFAGGLPATASVENVLDLVQFMIQRHLWREAEEALEQRIAVEDNNLELRMLLLQVHSRMGRVAAGEALIASMRELADTSARYRAWLEAAVRFADEHRMLDAFMDAETERLASTFGSWDTADLDRRLAFAEIAARQRMEPRAAAVLQRDLDLDPPAEARVRIRKQLISVLADMKNTQAVLRGQLEALADEDPRSRSEVNARLALLHFSQRRVKEAAELLQTIDVRQVSSPAVLRDLLSMLEQMGNRSLSMAVMERLTEADPTNRSGWQQWLSQLAAAGNEQRLRLAIRRLLAGVDRMPIDRATTALLKAHLLDSYWRSIAERLAEAEGEDADDAVILGEALALVDSVDQLVHGSPGGVWVVWTRAYLLGRLGRVEARDESIAEMERLAALGLARAAEAEAEAAAAQADSGSDEGGEAGGGDVGAASAEHGVVRDGEMFIAFPDGLTLSLASARALLSGTAAPFRTSSAANDAVGPKGEVGGLAVRWAFTTRDDIVATLPINGDRVLIVDRAGEMSCVDAQTGKLLWARADAADIVSGSGAQVRVNYPSGGYGYRAVRSRPAQPIVWKDFVLTPRGSSVECRSLRDGSLRWRGEGVDGDAGADLGQPPSWVLVEDGHVVLFDPSANALTWFEQGSGKLVRSVVLPTDDKSEPVDPLNVGAAVDGSYAMVFGRGGQVVNVKTGEVVWSFEPQRVRAFPFKLREPDDESASSRARGGVASSSVGMAGGSPGGAAWATGGMSSFHRAPQLGPASGRIVMHGMPYPLTSSYVPYGPTAAPGGISVPAPVLIDYLGRPTSTRAEGLRGYVPPAVAWTRMRPSWGRAAMLAGNRLVLAGDDGLTMMRLDLPLTGQRVRIAGAAIVGRYRDLLCLIGADSLRVVNVTTGAMNHASLGAVAGPNLWLDAAIDGPLVYVAGRKGLMAVNIATGHRLFAVSWAQVAGLPSDVDPDMGADAGDDAEDAAAAGGGAVPAMAHARVYSSRLVAVQQEGGSQRTHGYTWSGRIHYHPQTNAGAVMPFVGAVGPGVWYTAVQSNVLVAVEQGAADAPDAASTPPSVDGSAAEDAGTTGDEDESGGDG